MLQTRINYERECKLNPLKLHSPLVAREGYVAKPLIEVHTLPPEYTTLVAQEKYILVTHNIQQKHQLGLKGVKYDK